MLNVLRLGAPLAIAFGVLTPDPAWAYIGPGAGLGAIAITVAFVLGMLLLVIGLVWYPLKRLIKGNKTATAGPEGTDRPE